jgi:RNA polymerase sigma factor (sigma-70 family)
VIPAAWPAESVGSGAEERPDARELAALADGDDAALSRLIHRWQRPLFAFAHRYLQNEADAADMVAETFAKLHGQRRRFSPDANLSTWLFTVLANRCCNRLRWAKRHPADALDQDGVDRAIPCADLGPDATLQQRERFEALRRALAALPHELKTTLLLHHYEQLSYREIAAITGCAERGVETRLYRARQKLRESLGGVAP